MHTYTQNIILIAEEHGDREDKQFRKKASSLAEERKIILVRENKVFNKSKDGLLSTNIFGAEDKLVWEYTKIVMALWEIYPLLKKDEELGKSLLEIYKEIPREHECFKDIKSKVLKHLDEYIDSVISLFCNTNKDNPVSVALIKILEEYKENTVVIDLFKVIHQKRKDDDLDFISTPSNFRRMFIDNIFLFNKVLNFAALKVVEIIKSSKEYSIETRSHKGVTDEWINQYFAFQLVLGTEGKSLLDYDEVVVNLRNVVFAERLINLARKHNNVSKICFIVGSAHITRTNKPLILLGDIIESQLKTQHCCQVEIWSRADKAIKIEKLISKDVNLEDAFIPQFISHNKNSEPLCSVVEKKLTKGLSAEEPVTSPMTLMGLNLIKK